MRVPAILRSSLLFVPYALAVWVTAYQGLHGDDALGLVCGLLLLGGVFVLVYAGLLRRTVSSKLFSPAAAVALALLGFALGTLSSGEAGIGIAAGFVVGGGAAVVMAMSAARRHRRPKTIFLSYRRSDSGDITPRIRTPGKPLPSSARMPST